MLSLNLLLSEGHTGGAPAQPGLGSSGLHLAQDGWGDSKGGKNRCIFVN